MSEDASGSPAHFELWTGRAGLVNTALCLLLALLPAWGLRVSTERGIAAPACIAYGHAQGLIYTEIALEGPRNEATAVCRYVRADGSPVAIEFNRMASFLTDLWASFALDMRYMWGVSAVLLALGRTALFVHGRPATSPA